MQARYAGLVLPILISLSLAPSSYFFLRGRTPNHQRESRRTNHKTTPCRVHQDLPEPWLRGLFH
jgi:hypothetical protein